MMKKIGKYIVKGLLGKGGMGRVYKVETPSIKKISALKLLQPDPLVLKLLGKKALTQLFIDEALTMAEIRHPHIVDIRDFNHTDEKTFYVMEYYCNNLGVMMGESYLLENPSRLLPVDKAIDYTRQILSGLSRLHFSHIIHRDIKPYNILITDDDRLKICDFGLSKYRGESFKGPQNLNVGSPFYAAPEQEKDPDSADFTADLYSTGVIFYRMLTGKLPLDASDKSPYKNPSDLNPGLNTAFDAFISKAMMSDRSLRFQTAEKMLGDLDKLSAIWIEQKEKTCSYYIPGTDDKKNQEDSNTKKLIRQMPLKISKAEAEKKFNLNALSRPKNYFLNSFNRISPKSILDQKTSLIWQQSGSDYPITWEKAQGYIKSLNDSQFDGRDNWRLPTVSELVTLLSDITEPKALCLEPLFDPRQKWIWSADRQSFIAAWFVSMELGFIWYQDFSAYYYVKAVSTLEKSHPG